MRKIKVLIVDDSLVFRTFISRALAAEPRIAVVGEAGDAFEAAEKIKALKPDVITCDIEMPEMNGIDFLKSFLPKYPIPTIVVSSVSNIVFDAINAGAVDFISKPDERVGIDRNNFVSELIAKIVTASLAKVNRKQAQPDRPGPITGTGSSPGSLVIAMGASTGGTEAVFSIIKQLPNTLPGIVVVQHIPPVFSRMFAERLSSQTPWTAKEAKSGDHVRPGRCWSPPAGSI
jgi:two-component system chemotaxis response regulator CheB